MELIAALEDEIRDHFRPKMGDDEELTCLRGFGDGGECRQGVLTVEFTVPWFGFMLLLIVCIEEASLKMYKIDNPFGRKLVYKQDIAHPRAIDDLLVRMENEWDLYLGRSELSDSFF